MHNTYTWTIPYVTVREKNLKRRVCSIQAKDSFRARADVEARDFGTEGLTVATELDDDDIAIFVDSIESSDEPGTLMKTEISVEGGIEDAGELTRLTLHEVGIEGLLKFSKSIEILPGRIYLVGCVPKMVEPSLDLSPEVARA